jgi:glycerol-3-phosphate cytidylyltransferase-like family protein
MTHETVGYLAQSFDLINVRDLDLISQASEHCSKLVVGVYTDEFAEELYGRRPVVPLSERVALVSHVRGVDQVVIHGDNDFELGAETVVFTVDGQVVAADATVQLASRRYSESTALREALEPADRGQAVA